MLALNATTFMNLKVNTGGPANVFTSPQFSAVTTDVDRTCTDHPLVDLNSAYGDWRPSLRSSVQPIFTKA
jgi:hypothetical protein